MAKAKSPLMSFEASGKFGERLVFSKRKSGQQVRFQRAQKDKDSEARTAQRYIYTGGVSAWKLLNDEEKGVYNSRAKDKHMTGYNLFMQEYLNENAGGSSAGIYGQGLYGVAIFGNS